MIGLSFLVCIFIWLTVVVMVSRRIPRWLGNTKHAAAVSVLFFPLMLIAPIADELIGRWQFYGLCDREAVVTLSPGWESVKRAQWVTKYQNEVYGHVIPITQREGGYVNSETGEVFFRSRSFLTHGGFLRRTLGPLWGNATTCLAKDFDKVERNLNLKEILK